MPPAPAGSIHKEIGLAVAAVIVALAARLLLDPALGSNHPYVFLYGSLAVTALFARWQVGAVASLLGFIASHYLFAAPKLPLVAPVTQDFIGALAFGVSATLIIISGALFQRAHRKVTSSSVLLEESNVRADTVLEDLREAGERMRSVVDNVIDGIITIDERGTITTFNRAAERIFGYAVREVIGQNVKMLMPDPYRAEHDSYIHSYLRTGKAKIIGIGRQVVGRRKDGVAFPMELAISEFRLGDKRYFTGIVRDITERKQAEAELRQAEERMRSVVDHVLDAIITIDEKGRIESFNKAAERIFGYSAPAVMGKNVRMLMPEPYHSEHDAYLDNYLRTGQRKIIGIGREVVGRRRDGSTFPMELAVSEFSIGGRRFFTGIVRDITERKRLEDQLKQRLQDLAEADRQKNDFLAMLGHELRNPLAPMSNALYLMRRARSDTSLVEQAQSMIERQLQHLVRLVDDLLDLSRIVQGKIDLRRERIRLGDAIRRAVETSQPTIDANGHVLDVVLPERDLYVMGDLIRLAQAVSNLLNNAAKYSSKPSQIVLRLTHEGTHAAIAVTDEGAGIPPDLLPRVFDLFVQGEHTLARSQGGLGIGLTLVRRVVEMHNGSVSVSSLGRGKGSEFTIRLPVLPESQGPVREPGGPSAEPIDRPRRVLVVDDNVDAANSIAKILSLFGHTVRCAHDGPEALSAANDFEPEVIVLDIGLPGMDGYEVARRLRASDKFRRTALIALTGYGQEDDRALSREAGFDQHLTKPVDPDLLNKVLRTPSVPSGP
jgi:PAS domain S-box-containing protein